MVEDEEQQVANRGEGGAETEEQLPCNCASKVKEGEEQ
jgi:hypothetical protein